MEGLLKDAFAGLPEELSGHYHPLSDISAEDAAKLQERGLLFQRPAPHSLETSSGAARHWPLNRGIFASKALDAAVWVNDRDHAFVICQDTEHADIAGTFQRFARLSGALEKHGEAHNASVAWDQHLGFLGTDPQNLGTSMRLSVTVSLPALSKQATALHAMCKGFDLVVSPGEGDDVVVSNARRVGLSETQLVQTVIDGLSRLLHYETHLAQQADPADTSAVLQMLHHDLHTLSLKTIFVGPPGAGKGTQAPRIKHAFQLAHLSTGDMLRDAVAKGTELGKQAQDLMSSGKLVGDDLVAQIVAAAIDT